jgi:ATP-dependent DNA helicase RecG
MFLLLGLGERAGSGLPKIKQGWTDLGHDLHLYDSHEPYVQSIAELSWAVNDGVNEETTQETTQEISQVQIDILHYLAYNPKAIRKDIALAIGDITEDGIKYQLKKLQEKKMLQRVGSTKAGSWKVLK